MKSINGGLLGMPVRKGFRTLLDAYNISEYMVYLVLFTLLFLFIIIYDLEGNKQYKKFAFLIILTYLILLSGLSYRIGSDTVAYMEEYKLYLPIEEADYDYIFGFFRRQPGWMILVSLCKTITPSFFFFKFIHAVIINTVFLNFIWKNCKLVFSSVLFYIIISYLYFNFEILRESLAIAAFVCSYRYFKESKWVKYYLWVFIGIMFHESALLLLAVPFIKVLFPFAKKYGWRFFVIFVLGLFVVSPLLYTSIEGVLQLEAFAEKGGHYLDDDSLNSSTFSLSLIKTYLLYLAFPLYVMWYKLKKGDEDGYMPIVLIYIAAYIVYIFIPILYRTLNYFQLFYILFFVEGFREVAFKIYRKQWRLPYIVMTACFLFIFVRLQFAEVGDTGVAKYNMYYPYTSIFEIDDYSRIVEREKLLAL